MNEKYCLELCRFLQTYIETSYFMLTFVNPATKHGPPCHKSQLMDFHLHASAFSIVFKFAFNLYWSPPASSIFQHPQLRECYSGALAPGDLGEGRVHAPIFTLEHSLLQLGGRVWKEDPVCLELGEREDKAKNMLDLFMLTHQSSNKSVLPFMWHRPSEKKAGCVVRNIAIGAREAFWLKWATRWPEWGINWKIHILYQAY